MTPLLRSSCSLWTVLLCSALLEGIRADCNNTYNEEIKEGLSKTTTNVTLKPQTASSNCSLITNNITGIGSLTSLTPGTVYQIFFQCSNCSNNITTDPEAVTNLKASVVTTSSILVRWDKPPGKSSSYKVLWTDGNNRNATVDQESKNITDLSAGVQYKIIVSAVAEDNLTEGTTATLSQYTKPNKPTNLIFTNITTTSIHLTWNEASENNFIYKVQWTDGANIQSTNVTETNHNVTELTPGGHYCFTVTTVAGDNVTTSDNDTTCHYTKPEVVRNVSVYNFTTWSVFVTWTKPEGNSSFYRLQWTGGHMTESVNVSDTSKNITDLTAGVQYVISITAAAGDGYTEGASVSVSQYTNYFTPDFLTHSLMSCLCESSLVSSSSSCICPPLTEPEVVRNVSVYNFTTWSVFVTWTKPEGNSSFYRLQWTGGHMTESVNVSDTSKNITDLTAGVQYVISITAASGDGYTEGASVSVSQYTKPDVVRYLSVTETTTSSVHLNWTEPLGNSSFYKVQWTDGANIQSTNVTETNHNVTELTPGGHYCFTVTTVAGDNVTTSDADTTCHYTKPEVVRNVSVYNFTTWSVFVTWTKPEGNSSFYRLQWTGGHMTESVNVSDTSKNITDLTAGVQYVISITAAAGDGYTEGASVSVSQYTKPDVVRYLSVTETTTSSVHLNWTEPLGNGSFYKVQWTDGANILSTNVTETNHNVTELTPGGHYCFTVTTVAGDNVTTSDADTTCHYTKPEVVRNVSVYNFTASSVFVTWTKPEGNSSFYRLQWTGGHMTESVNVSDTSKNITDLTAGVQYVISITAAAGDGYTEGTSVSVSQYTKPDVVRYLSVTETTTSSVHLNWTEPLGNSSFYKVQWTDGANIQSTNVTETNHNVTELTPGGHYCFTVTTVAGDNVTTSDADTTCHYTKPDVVRYLSVTETTTSSVHLNWTEPLGNSSFYKVQWTDGANIQSTNVTETNHNVTELTPGGHYCFTVTTVVGDNVTTSDADTTCHYTKPEVVRNVSVYNFTTWSVFVTWTKPEGNSSFYRLQWTGGHMPESVNVSNTSKNITDLTAGVQFLQGLYSKGDFNGFSNSDPSDTFPLTEPDVVRYLSVTETTTSSVHLNWTEPLGNSSFYKVQWTDGANIQSTNVTETNHNVTELTPGGHYCFTVTTVVGDNVTTSDADTTCHYTSKMMCWNFTDRCLIFLLNIHYSSSLHSSLVSSSSSCICPPLTEPEVVRNVSVYNFTASSVFVTWTKPEGNSSFYRLQWTGGHMTESVNVSDTSKNITDLTAGVQYVISITAAAGDGYTEGASVSVSQYTKPDVVRYLSVTETTTSSVHLNWTEPLGNSSFYKVQWTDGANIQSTNVTETNHNVTELTPGGHYCFTVTTVAGDNVTTSDADTTCHYTSKMMCWIFTDRWLIFLLNIHYSSCLHVCLFVFLCYISLLLIFLTYFCLCESLLVSSSSSCICPPLTEPEVVKNVSVYNFTTWSVFVTWTKPEGNSSFYRLQWTGGHMTESVNVSDTSKNITDLTAGVQYVISITAAAGDGYTEGASVSVSQYTRPGKIGSPSLSTNTTSISLNWASPTGQVFMYKVVWDEAGGSQPLSVFTNKNSSVLSNLIPGTSYTITITAVAGDNQTEGEPCTVNDATEPAVVGNLTVDSVTTSSVVLKWTKKAGKADSYKIQWNSEESSHTTITTNTTHHTIEQLVPGVLYNITVTAVATKEGAADFINTYTRPEKPENITVTGRGTDELNITWTLTRGMVDHYVLNVSNDDPMYLISQKSSVNMASITGLHAGRLFVITVISVAGGFENSSSTSLATVPTSPGSISFSHRTNSSLQVDWTTPHMMDGAPNISYSIKYESRDGDTLTNQSTVNSTHLSDLKSGTLYNITIETVGPQNLRSTPLHDSTYTLPNPVLNVVASSSSTTSIEVTWSDPLDVKQYYEYLVEVHNSTGGLVHTKTVNITSYNASDLQPGSRYDISVTTVVAGEFKSATVHIFTYTQPKAVTNLTAVVVNSTTILLTWDRQSDYKATYSYLVEERHNTGAQNRTTTTETLIIPLLIPGTQYTFHVSAVVEGVSSKRERIEKYTLPENVLDLTVIGGTTTLNVSWTKAVGPVSSYTVQVYMGNLLVESNTDLKNGTEHTQFSHKIPGVLYCVKLVTISGPVESTSETCNATLPTPPGPITVDYQTVSSINFTWSLPDGMNHSQYNFSVSNSSGSYVTKDTWFLLKHLESGSPYQISVVTVGVWGYESTTVTTENYTRPYSVNNLHQTDISTGSVTLVWEQLESKPSYSYEVKVIDPTPAAPAIVKEMNTTVHGLESGRNVSFTVTTLTADGTQAEPVPVSYFTRPYHITELKAITLNTTTIRLKWTKPFGYKDYYKYLVQIGDNDTKFPTLDEESTISKLIPGTNYTFCVTVLAAKDAEGEQRCISQYTKPEREQPSISNELSNSSVMVSWNKPPGNVENYVLHLNSTSEGYTKQLDSSSTSFTFNSLSAGTLYSVLLATQSGPFNASSEFVTTATFPNPPGPIEITKTTNSSIGLKWEEAPLMTGASFHYVLNYTLSENASQQQDIIIPSANTSVTLSRLDSGTPYSITLKTVGPMNFESNSVGGNNVTTRPLSVRSLNSTTKETSIKVTWTKPQDYKENYRYNLTWQGLDKSNSITLQDPVHVINNLKPGSAYAISVNTETSDGTQSVTKWINNCTNASPVTDVKCYGPNLTDAELILSWTEPAGQSSGFQIIAEAGAELNESAQCCKHNVSGLKYNTEYNLRVTTQSCGRPSTPVSKSCRTGITYALPPKNLSAFSEEIGRQHDQFTIQINLSYLDYSRGPITHIGVLIGSKSTINDTDGPSLRKYLGNTYDEFVHSPNIAYLATVKSNSFNSRSSEETLTFVLGDESTWNGYTNGRLTSSSYRYAFAIFTTMELNQNNLVDTSTTLVTVTEFHNTIIILPQQPVSSAMAIGVPLGIFAILFIILLGFIIYWKRIYKKEVSDIQIHSMRARVSAAVRVEDYDAYYRKQKADSNCGFAEEFEDLKLVGTGQSKIHALTVENKPKNRYNNVLPYDSSRVKLSIVHGSPYDDYINANYMPGYLSRKEFVAAQGPLPTTVNEFWRMIWEKNVQTLVMLTRCNEQGRVKCEQYWDPGTKHFDEITVTTTSEIPLDDWTIRDFDIKNVRTAEVRSVRHFHFTAWPDHGVPETTELLISFRHLVREHMNQYSRNSPTLVHCSAGVGRTGTFIAIDRLIFQIERENIVDVYGIVYDLRMHRPLMVQTEDQYVFLNQCALDVIRSRTGNNVDLIYQNTAALSIYENVLPKKRVA
ncbi:receptor-type tyrosine-protein phosphatase beta-like [Cololabis saira]|uniref:receptor-type tyrosine-protein phosphatase beta-like n=1 Tax=Cololabis saira TaxID=129043 RepID=UPI002AD40AB6|nr:receptor-type tyrosine-protein phosphatase beta-like [Cololabis saira]